MTPPPSLRTLRVALHSLFSRKRIDWNQIIDSADIRLKCEAHAESAEDQFWERYDNLLRTYYGDRVKRVGQKVWVWR